MTDAEKVAEWARFYQAAPPSYKPWALKAVLVNDGESMLQKVIKSLRLDLAAVVKDL